MSTDPVVIVGLARTPMGAFDADRRAAQVRLEARRREPVHRRRRSDRDGAGMRVIR